MKLFSYLTLSLTTTLIMTSPLHAKEESPSPCPLAFAGFSFGGTVGYGIGKITLSNAIASTITGNTQGGNGPHPYSANNKIGFSGVDGGLIAGYLYRFGNWGVGADFLANWTSASDKINRTSNSPRFSGSTTATDSIQVKLKNALQARGVFSYVLSNLVMPKLMLGWDSSAYQLIYNATLNVNPPSFNAAAAASGSKRLNGFLWGAGVDFLVAQNIVCGLEYTGVQSQKITVASSVSSAIPAASGGGTISNPTSASFKSQYNTFKAIVKYIF